MKQAILAPCMLSQSTTSMLAQSHANALQKVVLEYVWLAQRLSPEAGSTGTRLLFSFTIVRAQQSTPPPRPIAISATNDHLLRDLEDQIAAAAKPELATLTPAEEEAKVAAEVTKTLQLLPKDMHVIILAPASFIPISTDDKLPLALKRHPKVEFVLLHHYNEHAPSATTQCQQLAKVTERMEHVRIREVERDVMDLRILAKEWLYLAAPCIPSSVYVPTKNGSYMQLFMWQIRQNFAIQVPDSLPKEVIGAMSFLHSGLQQLQVKSIVPLRTVHPAMILGCPLHATLPIESDMSDNNGKAAAFLHSLQTESLGAVLSCQHKKTNQYYLLTSPASDQDILLYRLASSEEFLLPTSTTAPAISPQLQDEVDACIQHIPHQAFNPFHLSSNIISTNLEKPSTHPPGRRKSTKRKRLL